MTLLSGLVSKSIWHPYPPWIPLLITQNLPYDVAKQRDFFVLKSVSAAEPSFA